MSDDAALRRAARERAARKEAEQLLEERSRALFLANEKLSRANEAAERLVRERTRELESAMHAAESANRAKTAFLARMSHEIRTPLTAILGFSQELNERADAESRELLGVIERNGTLLLALVEDLLDFAAIDAEKIELRRAPFDLFELAGDVHASLTPGATAAGLTLALDIGPDVPRRVLGDARRLRQVLLNIGGNAIKYTDEGHVALRLHAGDGAMLRVEVEDSGLGIAPRDLASIFDAFQQVAPESLRGGVGLGLAIAARLTQAMGGTISVESQLGVGSRFLLEFPLPRALESDATPRATPPSARVLEGLDVLVADDSPDNRRLLRFLLERRGARVRSAANGQEALDAIATNAPHVVIMDVQMPGVDGLEATRTLRTRGNELPVVMLTAHALDEVASECLRAGASDVLTKPLDKNKLVETLQRYRFE